MIVKQNRWFSLTMRSHFWPLFAIFLQKMNFWSSKRCISWSNSRTNLIFDSGKIWDHIFFRKWKLEKGGAKGGRAAMSELTQWLCKKYKFDEIWRHQSLLSWYKWSELTCWNVAPPFAPLSYSHPQSRNCDFFPFFELIS